LSLSQFLILTKNRIENEANNEPEPEPELETETQQPVNGSSTRSMSKDPAVGEAWKLITNQWQLEEPKMIISVTGGARRFYMKQRLLKSFKRGLMKAATATGE